MSSQRRSCSICRSRSLISAMAHPPGAGQSRGRRPLRTAQGSPGKGEDEPPDQSVPRGRRVSGDNSILELARAPPTPTPASPHIGPRAPSVPQPGPPPANSRRTPRARAGDGGLEGSPTITAAATPALALGLPLFLLPFALGRRHHRFYFRPRRGSSGRPVPPRAGCGVIHALPLPRRVLTPPPQA